MNRREFIKSAIATAGAIVAIPVAAKATESTPVAVAPAFAVVRYYLVTYEFEVPPEDFRYSALRNGAEFRTSDGNLICKEIKAVPVY